MGTDFGGGLKPQLTSSGKEILDYGKNAFGSGSAIKAVMIASGGLSGGISSSIAGGSFWRGVREGIITSGLNHVAKSMSTKTDEAWEDNDKGKNGNGKKVVRGNVINLHDKEKSPGLYAFADQSEAKPNTVEVHAHAGPQGVAGMRTVEELNNF